MRGYVRLRGYAAATGAHMHIRHLNSTSLHDVDRAFPSIQAARKAGLKVSVGAYPYGAGETAINAAFIASPDFIKNTGSTRSDIEVPPTGHVFEAGDELHACQKGKPGDIVAWHFMRPETNPEHQRMLDVSAPFPGGAIESDCVPWQHPYGSFIDGTDWPLPEGAASHPGSAGTFFKFLRQYTRGRPMLSLIDAVRKASLIPAQILENSVDQMKTKGRLQPGMDADIIVFDPQTVSDKAIFKDPAQTSVGMHHVMVNGSFVIRDATLDTAAFPGRPARRPVTV